MQLNEFCSIFQNFGSHAMQICSVVISCDPLKATLMTAYNNVLHSVVFFTWTSKIKQKY